MSRLASPIGRSTLGPHSLEHYEPIIGAKAVERVRETFLLSQLLEDRLDLLARYERSVSP
jgi:hypothetical protein